MLSKRFLLYSTKFYTNVLSVNRFGSQLTHINHERNTPKMVDVSNKQVTLRVAHARASVLLPENVTALLITHTDSKHEIIGAKGPVFATAVVAGVLAAKKTSDLIPFCHPVSLEDCAIDIHLDEVHPNTVHIDCVTRTTHKTGIEMEALVGATNAALCIYDMLKAVSHDIQISEVKLMEKSGAFGKKHEALKKKIHSFRIPLPPKVTRIMPVVYFFFFSYWGIKAGLLISDMQIREYHRRIAADKELKANVSEVTSLTQNDKISR